jgi:hypothetical protein
VEIKKFPFAMTPCYIVKKDWSFDHF